MSMEKEKVLAAIETSLVAKIERLARASEMARAEATSEDNKAESKYDTRGLEAGYLANGQALEAESSAVDLRNYRALFAGLEKAGEEQAGEGIRRGSLVRVRLGTAVSWLFVGLESGGFEVDVDGTEITVISTGSPLAKQMLGMSAGGRIAKPVGEVLEVL